MTKVPRLHFAASLLPALLQQLQHLPSYCMQGIVGTIPSSALAFLTLYLQLLGMSDFHASVCTALFLAGQAR